MRHLLAILLLALSAYSIAVRHENFLNSRSAIARAHSAKARELKAELERKQSDEYHQKMAEECAAFITWQREEWFRKTDEYAWLSNGIIAITLLYLPSTYLKRRKRNTEPGGGGYGSPAAGSPSPHR
ncbi:MAG: hypothetical protein M5U15_05150 [Kiritimatiellae bacterium]|nr:hypothetical protein [Kiritimatiellia bacterium]